MPSLALARHALRSVWLPDGRAFAIGGNAGWGTFLATVEMMIRGWNSDDEGQTSWRQVRPMLTARWNFGAVAMHNAILVVGGCIAYEEKIASVEFFTPPAVSDSEALGQWTSVQSLPSTSENFCCILFDGVVLNAGRSFDSRASKSKHGILHC